MRNRLAWFASVLAVCVACGDGGGGAPDAAVDAAPIERTDRAYILKRVVLPVTMEEVQEAALLFPNASRPLNKLSQLNFVSLQFLEGVPVQQTIDEGLATGRSIHVYVVSSGPLGTEDTAATITYYRDATDADEDPSNNFSGTGQIRLGTPQVITTSAHLSADGTFVYQGTEPGPFVFDLAALPDRDLYEAPGAYAHGELKVTEEGAIGKAGALITPQMMEEAYLVQSADLFTFAIENDAPRANQIKGVFDTDADGTVTVAELLANSTVGGMLTPDVDFDGDGTTDHISSGIFVELVPVEIVE